MGESESMNMGESDRCVRKASTNPVIEQPKRTVAMDVRPMSNERTVTPSFSFDSLEEMKVHQCHG